MFLTGFFSYFIFQAIEVGRENRSDFKLIAKALARMGNAHKRSGDLDKAKTSYEKALTEHRTPEYRLALSEVLIKKQRRLWKNVSFNILFSSFRSSLPSRRRSRPITSTPSCPRPRNRRATPASSPAITPRPSSSTARPSSGIPQTARFTATGPRATQNSCPLTWR